MSVKVVELPGLPPKGDVSDWLARGGTRADLEALVEATPVWSPAQSDSVSLANPARPSEVLTQEAALAFMNERHAVVRDAGKTAVINEERDSVLERSR